MLQDALGHPADVFFLLKSKLKEILNSQKAKFPPNPTKKGKIYPTPVPLVVTPTLAQVQQGPGLP